LNYKGASQHITSWLNDYCESARLSGFIIGISGGIDSALTSTLCAATGKKTILVNMPIRQSQSEYLRASNHIADLKTRFSNVERIEINLTSIFEQFEGTLPSDTVENQLAMANTRARLRMTTLYALGQTHACLVAGTGNKIEDFGVGFFTKYGDGGVDLSPIADLTKSDVKELEWAMDFNGDENKLTTREQEVIAIYRRLNRINKHKMEPIPVCFIPQELK
jgi:NAD+ synthase